MLLFFHGNLMITLATDLVQSESQIGAGVL
jgi:hypothetical protein